MDIPRDPITGELEFSSSALKKKSMQESMLQGFPLDASTGMERMQRSSILSYASERTEEVAESGRVRHTLKVACAKRPHGRLPREASDFLERRAHGRVPAAFWKNPEKIWLNLAKIQQNSGKICEILEKNSKKFSNF